MPRVLIVTDSAAQGAALAEVLAGGGLLEVVGVAASRREGELLARELAPEVAVVALSSPESEAGMVAGLKGAREEGAGPAGVAAVILTDRAAAPGGGPPAGALALLPRDVEPVQLIAAVYAAAAGLAVIHPDLEAAAGGGPPYARTRGTRPLGAAAGRSPRAGAFPELTPREREVLRMMADGLPNKTIAAELGITSHTVKFHIASILSKLDAESRTEAVTLGIRHGMILL